MRGVVAALSALLLALGVLVAPLQPAAAAPTQPFTAKFSANANGALTTVGNALLTCPASGGCTAAQNGGAADNNGFSMVHLDADGVAGTTNSSASDLALPPGATVLWAGLYWGGRLTAGAGGQAANANAANRMSLRAPGDTGYRTITASSATRDQFGPNPTSYNAYQRFADVTDIVRAAPVGTYWGANVAAATGQDRYAGWALTVAYSAPGLPLRNLTVFDGFDVVDNRNPQSVTVQGFLAPERGPVDAQLTMVAYEGDMAQTGDFTRLNTTQLATPLSPGANFFSSTNDVSGTSVTTRRPAHRNMLGFDVKNLGASGVIPNGATSATFTFSSNGDVYYPGVVGLAINLYAPDFTASSKTAVNLSGHQPARPGDTLAYSVAFPNTGQDPAVDAVAEDVLPPGTTYVPGSLVYVPAPGVPAVGLTDAPGDDEGEVDGRTVRVRLGVGADADAGGRIAVGGAPRFTFRVRLDPSAGGTTVSNVATLSYLTATTDTPATYSPPPVDVAVVQQADVSVVKEMSPDPAAVGTPVTATLTVTNAGPNTATAVTVTDQLPPGLLAPSVTTSLGSCSVADGALTCALGDMASGATATVTISGATASGSTETALTNVATVTTGSFDPVPGNNVSGDTVVLERRADLSLTKTPAPATARPGEPVRWTVTVTNTGPSDARDVRVVDRLDAAGQATVTAAAIASDAGVDPVCDAPTGRDVSCTVAVLPAGATATVTVEGTLVPDLAAGTSVANTAVVASGTPDPTPGDNTARATVAVDAPEADVRLAKSGPAQVVAGSSIAWTVSATNYGPSDAAGVVVTDTLPAGVDDVSATTSRGEPCTVTGRTVTCPVGALPSGGAGVAGASATVTVAGTVAPDATGTLTNTATSTTSTTDPDPGNDTATAQTAVTAQYDVAVTKTASRTTLPATAPIDVTYTVTVNNDGPSAARDVVVTDVLPPELDLVQPDPVDGCDATFTASGFTCTVAGPIAPGGTAVLTVRMRASSVLAGGPDVVQTVTVDAPGDTDDRNDRASWTLSGRPFVDLTLLKTADGTVTAGATATYTFQVTNTNDPTDPTENVVAVRPVVTDTLPPGVTFVSASVPPGGTQTVGCTTGGGTFTCRLGENVPAGASATIEVTVQVAPDVPPGSTLVNTATVDTGDPVNNPDDNPANNTSQASSAVVADGDVALSEFTIDPADPASTGPGTERRKHVTVVNNGPSVARGVTLRVERTEDAYVVDRGSLPQGCTETTREIVCALPDLAPGQSVALDYVIQVSSHVGQGAYPAVAQVSSTTPDREAANNVREAATVVGAPVTALAVTKTPVGTVPNPDEPQDPHPSFVAGGTFGYQLAVSVPAAGYADAQGVVLDDLLPRGFVATAVSAGRGSCTVTPVVEPGGGVRSALSCSLGTVPGWSGTTPSAPVVVTVTGTLDPDANDLNGGDRFAEQVPNTVTATTTTPLAGGATQVTATARVDVVEIADLLLVKTPSAPTVGAGGTVGFTLTVVNAGPSGVEHAVVTDALPVGFTLVRSRSECEPPRTTPVDETQAQPQVPPGPGQEFACRVGAVAAGESVSIHVVAAVDPTQAAGTYTNTATVGSLSAVADPANNTATADVAVERVTNLAISAAASTTTPAAGQDVTFTGFATNSGPSTADGTNGDTVFPPGFVPYADRVDVPFNRCTWNEDPPADPTTVPWRDFRYVLHCEPITPGARWEPGGAATNVVEMYVPVDTPAGSYTGSTVIRSDTPETTYADNEAVLTLTVQHVSDTLLVKELVAPDPVVAGSPAQWRLTITNVGPSVADEVILSDTVPDGTTYVSAQVEGGAACPPPEAYTTEQGDTETLVRCPVGGLAVGASTSVLVTLDVGAELAGEQLCNAAIVGSGSLDPVAADNADEACGTVLAAPVADVAVTLTPDTQTRLPGERASLVATVLNAGPDAATGVVATLEVPPGFTDYSGVPTDWPDDWPGPPPDGVVGSLTFAVGDLEPGERVEYRIEGTATGAPGDVLPFAATVTAEQGDANEENDTASAQVVLVASPTPPAGGPGPADDARGRPWLATTGADVAALLVAVLAAGAAGTSLLAWSRGRRRGTDGGPGGA